MRVVSSESNSVTLNHTKNNVSVDCFETKRLLPRRSRSSSVNSVSTAETCNSSINSSSRSLTISKAPEESRKRRVHFVSTAEEYPPTHSLPADAGELWYTQEDYKHFRVFAQQEGKTYRLSHGVVKDLQAVYEVQGNLLQASLSCSEHNNQSAPRLPYKQSMTLDIAVGIIGSDLRGLELLLLKQMRLDRKAVLKGVVEMQTKLPNGLSANERAIAIAAKARYYSRRFRQFAQVQGKADSMIASEIHAEKEEKHASFPFLLHSE